MVEGAKTAKLTRDLSMAFGFLKKIFGGSPSNGSSELNKLIDQIHKDVFPNGVHQQKQELEELANILGVPSARISGTFSYACSRAFIGNCDKETLVTGITRHDDGLSSAQIEKLARYVFTKLVKQKSGITDPAFIEAFLNAQGFLSDDYGGLKYDEIPGGYGEFGLSINNPVPVNGILSSDRYLNRLITSDGLAIKWNRLGSGGAENIENPIDIYNITDERGKKRETIYISPYHPSTSNKAPKGYKFK